MPLVNIDGRTMVVPDSLADLFGSANDSLVPPQQQQQLPDVPQYEEDPYHTGGGNQWITEPLWREAREQKPAVKAEQPLVAQAHIAKSKGPIGTIGQIGQSIDPNAPQLPSFGRALPTFSSEEMDSLQPATGATDGARGVLGVLGGAAGAIAGGASGSRGKAGGVIDKAPTRDDLVRQAQEAAYARTPEGRMALAEQQYQQGLAHQSDAQGEQANIERQSAQDQYNAKLAASQEYDRIAKEQERARVERDKLRQAKQDQVERFVHDADAFKVENPGFWGGHSAANNIGRLIAMAISGLGMALQGRGHETNPVISMFDEEAKKSVQLQMDKRAQLERTADRATKGLDAFDRISDSQDARFNAQMARAYERGIRDGDLAVAKYNDQRAVANWKVQRSELEQKQAEYKMKAGGAAFDRDVQKQQLANQKQQTAIAGGHLALAGKQFKEGVRQYDQNYELQKMDKLVEWNKAAQTAGISPKVLQEQGVAAPPRVVTDDADHVTLDRNTGPLKQADDNPWIIPTVDEAKDFRKKKAAAESIVNILDEIRTIRDNVGGESSWGNSNDYQRLQVLKQNLVLLKKAGTQGMSSDADMTRIEAALGADNPASFRSQAAKLDEGREQTVKQLNTEARALGYTGQDINYPDPLSFKGPPKTANEQAAAGALSFDYGKAPMGTVSRELGLKTDGMGSQNIAEMETQALRQAGGILPSVKRTIDALVATSNNQAARPKDRAQAQALLEQIATQSQDPRVRDYALANGIQMPTPSPEEIR